MRMIFVHLLQVKLLLETQHPCLILIFEFQNFFKPPPKKKQVFFSVKKKKSPARSSRKKIVQVAHLRWHPQKVGLTANDLVMCCPTLMHRFSRGPKFLEMMTNYHELCPKISRFIQVDNTCKQQTTRCPGTILYLLISSLPLIF